MPDFNLLESLQRGSKAAQQKMAETGLPGDEVLFSLTSDDRPEVHTLEELNSKPQVMPFVCMPTTYEPGIPNCHRMQADCCGIEVWMSPATKRTFDKITENKKLIMCMSCLMKQLEKNDQPN